MSVVEGARADAGTGVGEGPVRLDGRLKLVLVVLLVAQFMLAVDFSILNVALPVIGDGL
ncbi:MFS transporter, partial [Streptomyces sp. NPDC058525]